jgi:hypothetical protein
MCGDQQQPRVLEIGFHPLLRNRFPESVDFIDTRVSWADVRTYQRSEQNSLARFAGSFSNLKRLLTLVYRQQYDAVVVRALSVENSGGSMFRWMIRRAIATVLFALTKWASHGGQKVVAILDLTDHLTIHPNDRKMLNLCDLYFKRELASNKWNSFEAILPTGRCLGQTTELPAYQRNLQKLRPISLGIDASRNLAAKTVGFDNKKYDVFYAGADHGGIPARQQSKQLLKRLASEGYEVLSPTERLSEKDFRQAIRDSWLCLSPAGVGWDCYRHYEIALHGSCPVMSIPEIYAYQPFEHGISGFYFYNEEGLYRLVTALLANKQEIEKVTRTAGVHVRQYHTFDRLAEYIYSELATAEQAKKKGPSRFGVGR